MTLLTVSDALARLPVKMAEREFRRRVRTLGLCYKHGHQIAMSETHLAQFIETLCPLNSPATATPRGGSHDRR